VLRDMLAQLTADDLMSYPDAGRFVSRVSKLIAFPEDHLAETAGSDAVLRRLFMAYVKPQDVVVTLRPAYAMYELYTRIFQGTPRVIDYRSDRTCDVAEILAAIDRNARFVILSHPGQPVGTAMDPGDLRRIVEQSADVGALCLLDEAYYPFHPVTMIELVRRAFHQEALVVGPGIKTGMAILYENPREVGADRIVNAQVFEYFNADADNDAGDGAKMAP